MKLLVQKINFTKIDIQTTHNKYRPENYTLQLLTYKVHCIKTGLRITANDLQIRPYNRRPTNCNVQQLSTNNTLRQLIPSLNPHNY